MKTTSPEVLFAALLFLHVLINTISRVVQRLWGNSEPIFGDEDGFQLNLNNYLALQICFGVIHVVTIGFGVLTAYANRGVASFVYAILLGASVLVAYAIAKTIVINHKPRKSIGPSKQERWSWISFYVIVFVGLAGFCWINVLAHGLSSRAMPTLIALSVILCALNQTFQRFKNDEIARMPTSAPTTPPETT